MKILPFEGDSMDDSIEKDYEAKTPVRTVERGLAPSHLLTIMMGVRITIAGNVCTMYCPYQVGAFVTSASHSRSSMLLMSMEL